MGKLKKVNQTELRIYKDPQSSETSEYDVILPVTSTEAVIEPTTGETLKSILNEITAALAMNGSGQTSSFMIQASEPTGDATKLWINTTDHTMNYWNGSAWVQIVGVWG